MNFLRNKKKNFLVSFLFFFIAGGTIFLFIDVPQASALLDGCRDNSTLSEGVKNFLGCTSTARMIGNVTEGAGFIIGLLYGIFVLFGALASLAVTIFEWAVQPEHISGSSGILNLQAIYDMWQFIRDFFNLFFILVLLYIAFTTVFQIQKNFKQMILSLIIAALLVNFSFPISRFVIDATNVPMYFFANQMMSKTQNGGMFGPALTASKLEGILLPKYKDGPKKGLTDLSSTKTEHLLLATIFMFMFAITLLVLAVMFVIRLVALIILVVFSSAGFASAIIPGMEKYSKMWWDNFWKYALFGPAAMLMLLISVAFLAAIGRENSAMFNDLKGVAINIAPNEPTLIASMAMFSVPIILLWFTIGLGQTMALAGGATISGYGHKFAAWAGKKASGYSAIKRNFDSYVATRKKRTDEKNKGSWGASLGKTFNKAQDAAYGKMPLPGRSAAQQRMRDMRNKEIYEKAEENDKTGISDPALYNDLNSSDKVKSAAAAISLTKRKAIKTEGQFTRALEVLGDNSKEIGAVIDNASDGAMAISGEKYGEMIKEGSIIGGNERLKGQLDSRLRKTGNVKTLIDYQTEVKKVEAGEAVRSELKNVKSAKDVAASESIFESAKYRDYAANIIASRGLDHVQEVKKASAQEGTSVGGYFGAIKSKEEVKKEKEEKKRDEDKKASSMMGSLKGSDYKYPSSS